MRKATFSALFVLFLALLPSYSFSLPEITPRDPLQYLPHRTRDRVLDLEKRGFISTPLTGQLLQMRIQEVNSWIQVLENLEQNERYLRDKRVIDVSMYLPIRTKISFDRIYQILQKARLAIDLRDSVVVGHGFEFKNIPDVLWLRETEISSVLFELVSYSIAASGFVLLEEVFEVELNQRSKLYPLSSRESVSQVFEWIEQSKQYPSWFVDQWIESGWLAPWERDRWLSFTNEKRRNHILERMRENPRGILKILQCEGRKRCHISVL